MRPERKASGLHSLFSRSSIEGKIAILRVVFSSLTSVALPQEFRVPRFSTCKIPQRQVLGFGEEGDERASSFSPREGSYKTYREKKSQSWSKRQEESILRTVKTYARALDAQASWILQNSTLSRSNHNVFVTFCSRCLFCLFHQQNDFSS